MICPAGMIDSVNAIHFLFRESKPVSYNVNERICVFVSVLST